MPVSKKLALFVAVLASLALVRGGDYEVATASVSLVASVAGPNGTALSYPFTVDIHHPTASCGDDSIGCVPVSTTENFPGAVVLVNFNGRRANYRMYARALAEEGYVVVVAEGIALINPFLRSVAPVTVTATVDYLVQNAAAYHVQADNLAIVGHSFGAAPAFVFASDAVPTGYCAPQYAAVLCPGIAASSNPMALVGNRFKAALGLGASRDYFDIATRTLLVNTFNTIVPVGFIWGSEDRTLNAVRRDDAYANGVNSPKALFVINGTGHLGMQNDVVLAPGSVEPYPYSLDQEVSIERHVYATNVFLRATLKGNQRSYTRIFVEKDIKGPRDISVLAAQA